MAYPTYSVDGVEPVFNKMVDQVRGIPWHHQPYDLSRKPSIPQKLVPAQIFSFYLNRWVHWEKHEAIADD